MKKAWYRSKTLIFNLLAILAFAAQSQTEYLMSPEGQASLLAAVNMALRMVTKLPLQIPTLPPDRSGQ